MINLYKSDENSILLRSLMRIFFVTTFRNSFRTNIAYFNYIEQNN